MKKVIVVILSAMLVLSLSIPAFAAETPEENPLDKLGEFLEGFSEKLDDMDLDLDFLDMESEDEEPELPDPLVGSWHLARISKLLENGEAEELDREKEPKLYQEEENLILTFDEDGRAHCSKNGEEVSNLDGSWKLDKENVYMCSLESGDEVEILYDEDLDVLYELRDDYCYTLARAVVGSWKLDRVLEIHEGDAPELLPEEGNQSLYASKDNILTFDEDGSMSEKIKDGSDVVEHPGVWGKLGKDRISYLVLTKIKKEDEKKDLSLEDILDLLKGEDEELSLESFSLDNLFDSLLGMEEGCELEYFSLDDVLMYDVKDESEDAAHPHLRFILTRYQEEKKPEAKKDEEKKSDKPAEPKNDDVKGENELIADGQIFSGIDQLLYDPETKLPVLVKELNQGGWVDEETGRIYYQEEGGGDLYYAEDGSFLVSEWYFHEYIEDEGEDELIAGGQIFSGIDQILYDPETRMPVLVKELNQGGWADEETGTIYYQEEGGGDHYYSEDGKVLISEWLMDQIISDGVEDFDDVDDFDDIDDFEDFEYNDFDDFDDSDDFGFEDFDDDFFFEEEYDD